MGMGEMGRWTGKIPFDHGLIQDGRSPQALFTESSVLTDIQSSLHRDRDLSDPRPRLVGFGGGKDSTLAAALRLLTPRRSTIY